VIEAAFLLQFMGDPRFEKVAETTLMIAGRLASGSAPATRRHGLD
jgi:hypothetical protein